jgi:hypothetical protein
LANPTATGEGAVRELRTRETANRALATWRSIAPASTWANRISTSEEIRDMKRLAFALFATALLALPIFAQDKILRAEIPFEFVVQNTTAPAGTYEIKILDGMLVQLVGGGSSRVLVTIPADTYNSSLASKLIFNRYGNQYFLSEVRGASKRRDFEVSRVERELKNSVVAAQRVRTEILLAMR